MKASAYKKIYLELLQYCIEHLGVVVFDTELHGPGAAFSLDLLPSNCAIAIDGHLSYCHRVFVLAHELGHLYSLKNKTMTLRKRPGTEKQANNTACRILILYKVFSILDYENFYNKFSKIGKYKFKGIR